MMTGMLILFSPALFLFIVEVVPAMKNPGPKGESTKGKSTEAKSGRPETPKLGKGRREQRRELAQIDRRVWHLWALSITVTLVLALAILVFFYPALKWRVYTLEPRVLEVLPQLILGLLALVVLESVYIIVKARELMELRNFILTIAADADRLSADYPWDTLTGVLDRRALPDIFQRETSWVDRYRIPLCLVLFDIREFSKINDKEGNLAGDVVLKELARTLQVTVRRSDSILRYGPDEFLCLLPRTDVEGGEAFIRRLGEACRASTRLRDLVVDSGLALYEAGRDANAVLAEAESILAVKREKARSPSVLQPAPEIHPA